MAEMTIPATPPVKAPLATAPVVGLVPGEGAQPGGVRALEDVKEAAAPVQVGQALREVNTALKAVGLEFEVDHETDKVIVRVIDKDSGEVIRQMPSEEVIRIAKVLGKLQGLLVEQTA
jgi:flagellar protein FlaG